MKEVTGIKFKKEMPESHAYFTLFQSTGWNKFYKANPADFNTAISNSWYMLCAYNEKDELIGFGRIVSDGILYAFICDMIVLPAYQNQGIGSNILERLIEKCKAEGIRILWLFSASSKSSFYKKHGFNERPSDSPGMQLTLC